MAEDALLEVPKLVILALFLQQLLMGAALHDLAVIHDQDQVTIADGGQAMRDHKGGASAHDAVHTALDELFGTRVDGTRGLVQDEHRRIGDGHARDGEQLTLTLRQVGAVGRDRCVVAPRQAADKRVGAGGLGMMGAAARGAYEMGGKIIGVVPYFFNTPGILFEHCTELIRMETMAERKTIMEERSDAFIALPGGIGTMEEIFEVITLSSLGRMQKKSAFLDAESYWEPAVELLRGAVEKGFAGRELNEHYARFTDVNACLDYLEK